MGPPATRLIGGRSKQEPRQLAEAADRPLGAQEAGPAANRDWAADKRFVLIRTVRLISLYIYIYISLSLYIYKCTYTYAHRYCVCVYVCVCIILCIHMYLSMYVQIGGEIERERRRDRGLERTFNDYHAFH